MLHWNSWWLGTPPTPPRSRPESPAPGEGDPGDWPLGDWYGCQMRFWQEWLAIQQNWLRIFCIMLPPTPQADEEAATPKRTRVRELA